MHLTPHEQERLLIHAAAEVAARRRERGLRLNHPEAVALITAHLLEGARDGRTVAELMISGRAVLTRDDVMEGVPEMIHDVQVEATFPDGTKLVTVHEPISRPRGAAVVPGEILFADEPVVLFEGAVITRLTVCNTADRPVQVGSHYHFAEANPGLRFDRAAARGKRLAVPAGTAVRFEPGIPAEVELVPLAGRRIVPGLRGETAGELDA